MDNAPASGAGNSGSIPDGGTIFVGGGMVQQFGLQPVPNRQPLYYTFAFSALLLIVLSCTPTDKSQYVTPETRIDEGGNIESKPNPFSPTTNYSFAWVVPDTCQVTVLISYVTGQVVDTLVNKVQSPGKYSKDWNGASGPSGVYFTRCTICGQTTTKQFVLLR
jgi:hypothetical protein